MRQFSTLSDTAEKLIQKMKNEKQFPNEAEKTALDSVRNEYRAAHRLAKKAQDLINPEVEKEKELKKKQEIYSKKVLHTGLLTVKASATQYCNSVVSSTLVGEQTLHDAFEKTVLDLRSKLNSLTIITPEKKHYEQALDREILDVNKARISYFARIKAEEAAAAVKKMNVNQQIFAIAPEQVQNAVKKLLEGLSTEEIGTLLISSSADEHALVVAEDGPSLVSKAINEALALTSPDNTLGQELSNISRMPPIEQLALVQELLTDSRSVVISQATGMALMASIIDKLAVVKGMPTEDRVEIRQFTQDLVSSMNKVENGEATHFSVIIEVPNKDGVPEVRGLHLDVRTLMTDPISLAARFAAHLSLMGYKSHMPMTTSFTTLPQVVALTHLEGRSLRQIGSNDTSLLQLVSGVLRAENTAALKAITGNDITKGALVMAKQQAALVSQEFGVVSSPAGNPPTVSTVLEGLAIVKQTVERLEAWKLEAGITLSPSALPEVIAPITTATLEESPAMHITTGADIRAITSENLDQSAIIAASALRATKEAADAAAATQKITTMRMSEITNKTLPLLLKITLLRDELDKNDQRILSCKGLIANIKKEQKRYGDDHTQTINHFIINCCNLINPIKNDFNTHKDNFFLRILGHIKEFFTSIVSNEPNKENRAAFFSTTTSAHNRLTKSAQALYDIDQEIRKLDEEVRPPSGMSAAGQ